MAVDEGPLDGHRTGLSHARGVRLELPATRLTRDDRLGLAIEQWRYVDYLDGFGYTDFTLVLVVLPRLSCSIAVCAPALALLAPMRPHFSPTSDSSERTPYTRLAALPYCISTRFVSSRLVRLVLV